VTSGNHRRQGVEKKVIGGGRKGANPVNSISKSPLRLNPPVPELGGDKKKERGSIYEGA